MKILALSEAHILAIHGLAIIAASKERATVAKISESTNSSANHLFKVFDILVKAKILYSVKGPAGGYFLKKPANEIYLIEIYEAISGKIDLDNLCHDKNAKGIGLGDLQDLCEKLSLKFVNFLQSTKLSDIKDRADII
ncbi:MAG: Rrf2 family transcriptional regulator [Bacteroidales bacterium]|jgi:Rrf2 family protein|nr:Rrf2 family transcriptional regulator [Bacteroidales bacterium]MCK9499292.1 Rrf2 family transcriptional regulator [Bacteroidales bacterium]MDY0313665.1 Rrf2 family transcriptional regulator [Bacteroidales bacterium]NLB85939.1 Rrf2 family transcriptional regulator [Bacteroidales bacterium]